MVGKLDLKCPWCDDKIIKSYDAEVKLRTKLVKWTSEGMFAVCKSCGKDVPVDPEILKSIQMNFVYEISG